MRFDWAILALAAVAAPAYAQLTAGAALKSRPVVAAKASAGPAPVALTENSDLVGGPLLGYTARADRSGVYPLHGFPGAAFPGPALALSQAGGPAVVSSVGRYALAAGERPGELLVYALRSNTASGRLLPSAFGVSTQPDQIVLSPLGRVALLYGRGRREIEILTGMPGRPVPLYTASLPPVNGVLTALAVSDDGAVALAAFSTANGAGEIYALRPDASASLVGSVGRVVHLAFVPDSRDGLAADYDRSQVLLLKDGGRQGMQQLAGRGDGVRVPTAVEATTQGSVIVVNERSPTLVVLSPAGLSPPGAIHCGCAAAALERLSSPDSFRLTAGAGVIAVLEAGRDLPHVFHIPAGEEADPQPASGPTLGRGRSR
jgi:hypothetical protein